MKPTIVAIVEGPGDEAAIRLLFRRWFHLHQIYKLPAIKVLVTGGVGKLLVTRDQHDRQTQQGVEYWVGKAQNFHPCAILVLLDADDECEQPKHKPPGVGLGPWLLSRARSTVGHIHVSVVVADRCFESWFFCPPCQQALLEANLIKRTDISVESTRARGKGRLKPLMGRSYEETTDQVKFSAYMPLSEEMETVSRSFRKLRQELSKLCDLVSEL